MQRNFWQKLALRKIKDYFQHQLTLMREAGAIKAGNIKSPFEKFDLGVSCDFFVTTIVVSELAKIIAVVEEDVIMECIDSAVEMVNRQRGWPIEITWVVPDLQTARTLHQTLRTIQKALNYGLLGSVSSKIVVFENESFESEGGLYEAIPARKTGEEYAYDDKGSLVLVKDELSFYDNDPDLMILYDTANRKEVKRLPYYDAGLGEYGKDVLKEPSYAQGIKAREQGNLAQRQMYQRIQRELEAKGLKVIYSEDRGQPDMLVLDRDKVIEVIAVKAYSLMVTVGKGCRNVKGKKYAVSFNPKRDAKAEYLTALRNGLNKIRLIAINLNTGNTIFDGYVYFDETITLREYSKNEQNRSTR